jgi:hypothetical protein
MTDWSAGNRITVEEGRHSRRGASSAHRFQACKGSLNLIEKLVAQDLVRNHTSRPAAEGTAAHLVLSTCLEDGSDAIEMKGIEIEVADWVFPVDDEMIKGVQECIDWVRNRILFEKAEGWDVNLYIEKGMGSFLDEDVWGTADVIIHVVGKCIIVVDFKYGKGVTVEPDSVQNKYYAYLVIENYIGLETTDIPVESWIAQPRIPHHDGTIRSHMYTDTEIVNWFIDELLSDIADTRDPSALLTIGDHCRFCPAKPHCPALKKEVLDFEEHISPEHLTDDELGRVLDKIKAIISVKPNYEHEALRRARDGRRVLGYKMVNMKSTRVFMPERPVTDDEGTTVPVSVEAAAVEVFGDDAFTPRVLKSPAQLEKLEGGDLFVQDWAYKPNKGLTLAPESDRRPEAMSAMERLRGRARSM